jgi:hypothetical protein
MPTLLRLVAAAAVSVVPSILAFTSPLLSYSRGSRSPSSVLKMGQVEVDVAVIGGGIAGTSISWLLREQQNLTVALIDPRVDVPVRNTLCPTTSVSQIGITVLLLVRLLGILTMGSGAMNGTA